MQLELLKISCWDCPLEPKGGHERWRFETVSLELSGPDHWSPLESIGVHERWRFETACLEPSCPGHWSPLEPIGGHERWRFETVSLELSGPDHWSPLESIGVHWSPSESIGVIIIVKAIYCSTRRWYANKEEAHVLMPGHGRQYYPLDIFDSIPNSFNTNTFLKLFLVPHFFLKRKAQGQNKLKQKLLVLKIVDFQFDFFTFINRYLNHHNTQSITSKPNQDNQCLASTPMWLAD